MGSLFHLTLIPIIPIRTHWTTTMLASGYWVSRIGGQVLLQVQLMTMAEKVAEEIKEIEATMAEADMAKAIAEQPGVPFMKNLHAISDSPA